MNYLQLNDNLNFGEDEKALEDFFGKDNFVPFHKKHLIRNKIKLTKNDFIAGDIQTMFTAMKQLGIEYSYNDYPECLKKYLHRKIWTSTMKDIKNRFFDDHNIEPVFIKPKDKLKRFTGFIIESLDELYKANNAGNNVEIICSETVNWVSEYRVPVIDGKIRDYCLYSGKESNLFNK